MNFPIEDFHCVQDPEPESWRGASEASIAIHRAHSLTEILSAFAESVASMKLADTAWVEIETELQSAQPIRMSLVGQAQPSSQKNNPRKRHPFTSRLPDGRTLRLYFEFGRDSRLSQQIILETLCEHFDIAVSKLQGSEDCFDAQFTSLSKREKEVIPHLANGKSNAEIGIILGISHRTVEKHVSSILTKFGCESRICLLARFGRKIG